MRGTKGSFKKSLCQKLEQQIFKKDITNYNNSNKLCSFALDYLNLAQTNEHFAGTCVPASPNFRNSGQQATGSSRKRNEASGSLRMLQEVSGSSRKPQKAS